MGRLYRIGRRTIPIVEPSDRARTVASRESGAGATGSARQDGNDPALGEGGARQAKAELRRRARERAQALDPATRQQAASALADHLFEMPELVGAEGVLACLGFGVEIDTGVLVGRLLSSGRSVWVPRTKRRTRDLDLCAYPCQLRRRSFGLEEPSAEVPALDPGEIDRRVDLALVLGLAFDLDGYRLGYGGGYFDRFLFDRPFPALGLAYRAQLFDRVPREGHDVPMTAVVTEGGVHRPASPVRCASELA